MPYSDAAEVRESLATAAQSKVQTNTAASRLTPRKTLTRSSIFTIVILLAFIIIPVAHYLFDDLCGPDEALLLVYPQRIISGQWPNRDFFTAYGPGQFWLLAGVYKIFGASVIAERLVGLFLHAALVIGEPLDVHDALAKIRQMPEDRRLPAACYSMKEHGLELSGLQLFREVVEHGALRGRQDKG